MRRPCPSLALRAALIAAALLIAATTPAAAGPLTWEQVLAENSPSSGARTTAPAHSKSKSPSSVPAVSFALANYWATLTWDADKGEWACAAEARPDSVAGASARCTIYPAMIALVITCPDGKQATAPSCFHPFIGDAPSTVYGWFARDDKVACGFVNPPQQDASFVVGGSAACMTVAQVVPAKAPKTKGNKASSGGR